jgi:hypothetical protein
MLFFAGGLFVALGLFLSPFTARVKTDRESWLAPFLVGAGLALLFIALAGAGG